jgi:hypothetical protein
MPEGPAQALPPLLIRPRKRFIEVARGSVVVKVYRSRWRDKKRHKQYRSHTIIYRELESATGQFLRRREKRALKKDALDRADQVATRLANNETLMLRFAPDDQARWQACKNQAAQIHRDPVILVTERVDFEKIRPAGVTDAELVRCWHETHPVGLDERHIPKIVTEFLEKITICPKYRRNLSRMLERFAGKFDLPFSALQSRDVTDWLDGLKKGLRTRHNHRAAVASLLHFAEHRGYVRPGCALLNQVDDPGFQKGSARLSPAKISIYTPDELRRLLARAEGYAAGRKLVPLIVITAFAGVRHGEMNDEKIEHLDWSDIDWAAKRIDISDEAAKQTGRHSGDGRWVDMPDNLVAWLAPYKRPRGKICVLANTSNAFCRLRAKAGITGRRRNALRKTWHTYKLALGTNIETVATQAGNSPGIIRRNYRAANHARYREDAEAWFRMMPDRADDQPLFAWAKGKSARV